MLRRNLAVAGFLLFAITSGWGLDKTQTGSPLTAEQVAERNVNARGGLQQWRAVHTLLMSGKMEAGGNNRPTIPTPGQRNAHTMPAPRPAEQVRLPFVMELERPHKTRMEIQFKGQTAIQVFDGAAGWKLRPFLNRREVEPFTEDETKSMSSQTDLDGPLVDYASKGTRLELLGMEKVEERNTYKLRLISRAGDVTTVWVDAETFLDVKMQGPPKRMDGVMHPVEVYFRDYRNIGALKIPFLLETKVLDSTGKPQQYHGQEIKEQIVLDKVEVNPKLDDTVFTKAHLVAEANAQPAVTAAKVSVRQGLR
jgi:hypothetical protein